MSTLPLIYSSLSHSQPKRQGYLYALSSMDQRTVLRRSPAQYTSNPQFRTSRQRSKKEHADKSQSFFHPKPKHRYEQSYCENSVSGRSANSVGSLATDLQQSTKIAFSLLQKDQQTLNNCRKSMMKFSTEWKHEIKTFESQFRNQLQDLKGQLSTLRRETLAGVKVHAKTIDFLDEQFAVTKQLMHKNEGRTQKLCEDCNI